MAPAELFTDAALADGRSPRLVTPVSVLVRDGILVERLDDWSQSAKVPASSQK